MRKELALAGTLSVLFHLGFLFGGELTRVGSTEETKVIEDVALVEKVKEEPPPPVKGEQEEENKSEDESIMPENLLASSLAEHAASSVALDVLTMRVKEAEARPPRPEALTIGIPNPNQVNTRQGAKKTLVFSIDQLDKVPAERFKASPRYPFDMKVAKIEGKVIMLLTVDTTGHVIDVEVLNSTNPSFEAPAIEAARKWRFEPGLKDGVPVSFKMNLPMVFSLR
jgi:periplasmic protein TonB